MGGFLYFVPGRTTENIVDADGLFKFDDVSPKLAAALKDVVRPCAISAAQGDAVLSNVHMNGPGEQAGVMIAPLNKNTGGPSITVNSPGRQDWYEVDGGKYWIGWVKGEVPGPLDLEREKTLFGGKVSDDRGHEWIIPIARSPHTAFGSLPKSYTYSPGGEPEPHVKSQWAWLWELAGMVNDQWAAESMDQGWLVQQVPVILGVNYRVTLNELNAFHQAGVGLVSEEFVGSVTLKLIHASIVKTAVEKKTEELK